MGWEIDTRKEFVPRKGGSVKDGATDGDLVAKDRLRYTPDGGTGYAPVGTSGGGGADGSLGSLVFAVLLVFAGSVVSGGYVLSSEFLSHYWIGSNLSEHSWRNLGIFVALSLGSVALVARFFGFLPGVLVGIIPTIPVYAATKGGVGFWYIVFHAEDKPFDNSLISWIALIGMLFVHTLISWLVQRHDEKFVDKLLRLDWIRTRTGLISSVILVIGSALAVQNMLAAVAAF